MTLNWIWSWRRSWVKANLIWVVGRWIGLTEYVDGRWLLKLLEDEVNWILNLEVGGSEFRCGRANGLRGCYVAGHHQDQRCTGHGIIARCARNGCIRNTILSVAVCRSDADGCRESGRGETLRQPAPPWTVCATVVGVGWQQRPVVTRGGTARCEPRTRACQLFRSSGRGARRSGLRDSIITYNRSK